MVMMVVVGGVVGTGRRGYRSERQGADSERGEDSERKLTDNQRHYYLLSGVDAAFASCIEDIEAGMNLR